MLTETRRDELNTILAEMGGLMLLRTDRLSSKVLRELGPLAEGTTSLQDWAAGLERRLGQVDETLEALEGVEVPELMVETHNLLLGAFECYEQGLVDLLESMTDASEAPLEDALAYLVQGDNMLTEYQSDCDEEFGESVEGLEA